MKCAGQRGVLGVVLVGALACAPKQRSIPAESVPVSSEGEETQEVRSGLWVPGGEEAAPREAINAEESLDDFDPLLGMVVNGKLQAPCVFENVRPGISFVVHEQDAWLRPSTSDDRRLVARDDEGGLWRVDHPRDIPLGGLDESGAFVQIKDTRTPLTWTEDGDVVLLLFEAQSTGPVEVVISGNEHCNREDAVLAAAAYWYWIVHPVSLGSEP